MRPLIRRFSIDPLTTLLIPIQGSGSSSKATLGCLITARFVPRLAAGSRCSSGLRIHLLILVLYRNRLLYGFGSMRWLVRTLRYKPEGRGFDSRRDHWGLILPAALWLGVDSNSNRNEYQEYLLGLKAAGALGWER